jgi:hypothetical protein
MAAEKWMEGGAFDVEYDDEGKGNVEGRSPTEATYSCKNE